jgi:hypothetical protein
VSRCLDGFCAYNLRTSITPQLRHLKVRLAYCSSGGLKRSSAGTNCGRLSRSGHAYPVRSSTNPVALSHAQQAQSGGLFSHHSPLETRTVTAQHVPQLLCTGANLTCAYLPRYQQAAVEWRPRPQQVHQLPRVPQWPAAAGAPSAAAAGVARMSRTDSHEASAGWSPVHSMAGETQASHVSRCDCAPAGR